MKEKKESLGWIMAVYLVGLFIGALNTGTITPVRTIIQSSLGVDSQTGIWMITIYTLFYAAIIPISGKLADRLGRKIVFLASITVFGIGSVLCGLSSGGSFALLLVGRVVQAVGAGGIMPIATAEFGTSFPVEKRGMALGLVGGVFGIANVLGATVGSAILSIFGAGNWEWVFYINIPFCVLVIIGGLLYIPNHKSEQVYKIDKLGTVLITAIILTLLYGLKNIDFFNFFSTLTSTKVYPFLLVSILLIPLFVLVEKKAEDPVFHIEYMKNRQIVLTLIMGMLVGCSMMGMIFIPQFSENALRLAAGSGGYFVIILGIFSGAASPVSGKLIDKYGSKPVLGAGFIISIIGALYLALVASVHNNLFNVVLSLILIGLGLGISMGTPLNYMMMQNTTEEESNSALATLSLVRSIGTAIAPAIMIGFIVQASAGMQADLMKVMPGMPAQTVQMEMMPESSTSSQEGMPSDGGMGGSDMSLPPELMASMQNADVTTITSVMKDMAGYMFDSGMGKAMEGSMPEESLQQMKSGYLSSIDDAAPEIEAVFQKDLNIGYRNMFFCVTGFNVLGFLLLLLYRENRRKDTVQS